MTRIGPEALVDHYLPPPGRFEYDGLPGFEDSIGVYRWRRHDWCGRKPVQVWSPGTWDAREWCQQVLAMEDCVYCGAPTQVIDHVDPVSRGGENTWTNYAPACWPCNSLKGARPLLFFLMRRRERLETGR